ncbi:hypothetical protein DFH05DRAFT_1529313 [Lentinula detonsa]|uniref:Uncharacterized protein n=1 Tax=Lentinula detonsa TaxID=2804962 RepID=A0A9W8NSH7_9AGAR|nr:hypothetical protein DFH05DRAFT_1529313 [Lentinula detonsa]
MSNSGFTPESLSQSSSTIYTSLTNLGLPKDLVTLNDFLRVYRHGGPLSDAILFFSEHFKGRVCVNEARRNLLDITESRGQSRTKLSKCPERPERSPGDVALSKLAKTKKDMGVYSSMLQDKLRAGEEAEIHVNTLKYQLSIRRRVNILLDSLEKKEKERIERFEEIGRSLVELRKNKKLTQIPNLEQIKYEANIQESSNREAFTFASKLNLKKPRHTRDALIVLNAYHLRLAKLSAHPSPSYNHRASQAARDTASHIHTTSTHPPASGRAPLGRNPVRAPSVVATNNASSFRSENITAAENQLRGLVAQKLGVEDEGDDPEIGRVFHGFVKIAKARTLQRIRYTSSMGIIDAQNAPETISGKELDRLATEVNQKVTALQDASGVSLNLAYGVEEAFVCITNSKTTTIPALQESLRSQSQSVRGYIDCLRAHIVTETGRDVQGVAQRKTKNSPTLFSDEVREILGLGGTVTSDKVLKEAERLIKHTHTKSQYLESIQLRPRASLLSTKRTRETEVLASCQLQKLQAEDATEKLLTRKIDKANSLGFGLVQDIEVLLHELNDAVGHERSK